MPIANVLSVTKSGVLSYHGASKLTHRSVAMPEIQERRSKVRDPARASTTSDYANFYLDARNPMLYKRRDEPAIGLCVLRISTAATSASTGAVLADRNAFSDYVRFLAISQAKLLEFWKPSIHGTGNESGRRDRYIPAQATCDALRPSMQNCARFLKSSA